MFMANILQDSMVHQTSPQHVVTKAAYLLFYRRRSDKPLGPPYLQQIVSNAYAGADVSLSGEDQRPDGSSSPNGSSGSSLEATAGANLHEDGQPLHGLPTGGHRDLESTARTALTTNDRPPAYGTHNSTEHNYDEGIGMESDPDDALPGYEDQQHRHRAQDRFGEPGWGFENLGLPRGPAGPPGSDNMADSDDTLNGSNAPEQGETLEDRLKDFDGEEDARFDDSRGRSYDGTPMLEEDLYVDDTRGDDDGMVKHVEFSQHDDMVEDGEAVELRLSDEEGV